MTLKAYILCHSADSSPIYNTWIGEIDHQIVEDYSESWQPPEDCGLVVSHLHYDFPTASLLKRLTGEQKVPVLALADGILEFRNTFRNPGVAPGSLFMPLHAHKLACIGPSQARIVENWGNSGKCEVVGLPRLDALRNVERPQRDDREFRILILTARKPGFTDLQLEQVRQSMADLKAWLDKTGPLSGKKIVPVWRLTAGLDQQIGVDQDRLDVEGNEIHEVMRHVDAVISTPSTTVVEAMLLDLPTAIIDYTNSPKYVSAAWTISCSAHFDSVVRDLVVPEESSMVFQRQALADTLQHTESAKSRMIKLAEALIEIGKAARRDRLPLKFPARLLPEPVESGSTTELSLKDIYPQRVGFAANEVESLTTEYDQLCRAIHQLHSRLDEQRKQLARARQETRAAWRHYGYVSDQAKWLRSQIQQLQLALRISNRPPRLQRRLRIRGSMALLKYQFFVDQVSRESQEFETPGQFSIDRLFEWTGYPKENKIPATIRSIRPNKKRNPQIKAWKRRPTLALIRKIDSFTQTTQKRIRALRVVRAK